MLTKVLGGIFTLLFIYAAVVQFNDPDSWLWIGLYILAAIASVLFMLKKLSKVFSLTLALLFAVLAVVHWPPEFEGVALQDGMKTLNIELARESLGMGIACVVMVIYSLLIRKK